MDAQIEVQITQPTTHDKDRFVTEYNHIMAHPDGARSWHFTFESVSGTPVTLPADHIDIKFISEKGFTEEPINMSPSDWAKIVHDLDEQLFEAMYYPLTSPLNIPVPPSENRTERMLNRKRKRSATVIDVNAKSPE